jgi:hypothetical protein
VGVGGDEASPAPHQHPPSMFSTSVPPANSFHQDQVLSQQILQQVRGSTKRDAPDGVSQSLPKRQRVTVLNVYCVGVVLFLVVCLANPRSVHVETVRITTKCKLHVMLVGMNSSLVVDMTKMSRKGTCADMNCTWKRA